MNPKPDASAPSPQRPVMNISKSLDRMGGDRTILHDLATFFLEDSQELLASLNSALTANDGKKAARSAHSLSGLSANFTAEYCSALGKAVEESCLKNDFPTARSLTGELESEVARLVQAIRTEILDGHKPS